MTKAAVNVLWPTSAKAEPGVVNRLGRVLHWFFTACAALSSLGMAVPLTNAEPDWGGVLVGGGFALVLFVMGRAARYILSGE